MIVRRNSTPTTTSRSRQWDENRVAGALAMQTFQRRALVIVPRCNWTGHECDLLVVCQDLRIIDVEIKISRADFKADAKKDKWWQLWDWETDGPWQGHTYARKNRRPRELPRKVWKHYFAVPDEIWSDDLLEFLPSKSCGVITLWRNGGTGHVVANVVKRAVPSRDAEKISPAAAVDIARLASLRMWDSFDRCRQMAEEINANNQAERS